MVNLVRLITDRRGLLVVAFVAVLVAAGHDAWAGPPAAGAPPVYDEQADAPADIQAALARAARDNKRVLIVWGANWCVWCHKLSGLFKDDPDLARLLLYEYEIVKVDIGRRDKNLDLAQRFRVSIAREGVPFLTILDDSGRLLTNQETGSLEAGDRYDIPKVKNFLNKWKAQPLDAGQAYDRALAQATKGDKRVLLHFSAPWCQWCRRFDDFLARPDIAQVISRDYVTVKIDVDRMTGGKKLDEKLRPSGCEGLPWISVLDAQGNALATSKGPQGNVGFPVESFEIAHFMEMLRGTARSISSENLGTIKQALEESAKLIKSAAKRN